MERKRKAEEDLDGTKIVKKSRVTHEGTDIFEIIPREILQIILLFAEEPLQIILLSLTSKRWNHLIAQVLTNKEWHKIYLAARKRFKVNIDGTVLDQVLQATQTRGRYRGGEVVFEWDFEIYDLPATSDCFKSQQDLIDDEYLAKFPVKYFFDQSDYTHVMDVKDIKHKKYDPSIDYKRLALKVELKYHQYELWRDSKALDEAFHNEECSCLKEETELVLYDENNEEITELESKYDISVKEDGYWKMTAVLGSKEFEDAWDERSNSDSDSATNGEQPDTDMTDETEVQSKNEGELMDSSRGAGMKDEADRQSENEGKLLYSTNPDDNLASVNDALVDSANSENSEEDEDEPQYDGLISLEQRDKILEDIALSERCLKLFIHVLSAIVLGHCPAPSCHDSVHINTAKFEHSVVRTGDIVDEVIAQLKYATTLHQSSSIISTMICALQKLRVMDLLFLKQGTEQKYPYLSAICSVYEVEDNISLVFYMADKDWGFEFDHSVNPWTSYFQADLATDDDLDAMPDWLSIRHSIHRLMRKGGVSCATPNATEFALQKLSEFIHKTLSSVVSKNPIANALEVTGEDIVETVETLDPNYRATLFTDEHNLFYENPIILNSDSEDYTDESSVDSDWIDEPITDLDDDTTLNDEDTSENEIDEAKNEDPLHSIIQESLEKCVQHAQFDAKEYNSEDEREDSTDERLWRYLDEYWDSVTDSAPGHDDKTAYYMPKNLVEEAITYSGQTLTEDDALAQLFIQKYEEDIPFHDMPDEQRNKIIELRRKTNQMLKEQCEEEFNQSLNTKYHRMKDNVLNYDSSLRSDSNECKTMIVDLSNSATLKRTVQDASSILRSNSVLKSVKLMNLFCTRDEHSSLFSQLIDDIADHPSIASVVLSNCRLMSYLPLSNLVKKKQLTKFHLSFPLNCGGEEIEGQNEFLQALQNSESIKDLMLPFGGEVFASTMTVMLPRLDTLHIQRNIAGASNEAGAKSIAELLQHPHQLKKVVVHLSRGGFRPTDDKPKLVELLASLNISHEVVYY